MKTGWLIGLVLARAVAADPGVERRRPVVISRTTARIIFEVSDGEEFWFEYCRIGRESFCRTITSSLVDSPETHRRLDDHVGRLLRRGLRRLDLVVAAESSVLALVPGAVLGAVALPRHGRIRAALGPTGFVGAAALGTALPTAAWAYRAHGGRLPELNRRRDLPPEDAWIDLDVLQPNRRGARRTVWLFHNALRLGANRVARDLDKHPTWKY